MLRRCPIGGIPNTCRGGAGLPPAGVVAAPRNPRGLARRRALPATTTVPECLGSRATGRTLELGSTTSGLIQAAAADSAWHSRILEGLSELPLEDVTTLGMAQPEVISGHPPRSSRAVRSGASMLLIAVTGPVGAGKTTLLATLAEWSRTQGLEPDGFVARAIDRDEPQRGAVRYDLEWVADGRTMPFAERGGSDRPHYVFRQDTLAAARDWAAALRANPPRPLIVLDEFGPLEARGAGHARLWPDLARAEPEVVVIAVRSELLQPVAARLGRRFDLVIDAGNPGAWERLRSACREHRDWMRIGGYGAGAGGIEMSLGSALHGMRVPLRGLILSSVQASVMTVAGSGLGRRERVVWVPFLAAGLKALSPAGSRLRPMLAITVQGILYGGAVWSLGWNVLGVGLGGWLIGAWSAAQGVVLQWLLVGDQLLRAYDALTGWVSRTLHVGAPGLWAAVGVWIALCGGAASMATLITWRRRTLPRRFIDLMGRRLEGLRDPDAPPPSRRRAALLGLRDLARPVFWAPLLVIAAVILAAGAPWGDAFWMAVRAVAIGFVVFTAARSFEPRRLAAWLRRRGRWGPAEALERAIGRGARDEPDETAQRKRSP
ncbi:MAG: DUF2478 domain-containing protein [Candidatus Eisenbacteria bacterium]|nr:DUF2478 domain-containing protein [Candidatus Eisenbacteria bacterium]